MLDHKIHLYELPKNDDDIFSKDFNIKESKYQLEPLLKSMDLNIQYEMQTHNHLRHKLVFHLYLLRRHKRLL